MSDGFTMIALLREMKDQLSTIHARAKAAEMVARATGQFALGDPFSIVLIRMINDADILEKLKQEISLDNFGLAVEHYRRKLINSEQLLIIVFILGLDGEKIELRPRDGPEEVQAFLLPFIFSDVQITAIKEMVRASLTNR